MAKFSTFPTLYDEVLTISIRKLKKWGYLEPNQFKSGILTWSVNGQKTASISITINTTDEPGFIELNYNASGEPINYKVQLATIPSNLGRGVIWAFICPQTGKRTRKLYLIDGYFYHREAFRGCMYECQTRSKKTRLFYRNMDLLFKADERPERYFRPFYAGKPTRTLKRLLKNKLKPQK